MTEESNDSKDAAQPSSPNLTPTEAQIIELLRNQGLENARLVNGSEVAAEAEADARHLFWDTQVRERLEIWQTSC